MWSKIIDYLLQGGFWIIIVRTIFYGAYQIFKSREKEVRIAKLLQSDIQQTTERITHFANKLSEFEIKNREVKGNAYRLCLDGLHPISITYKMNYEEIWRMLQKHSPESLSDLTFLYDLARNYDEILSAYRSIILGNIGISFTKDPNSGYQLIFNELGLQKIDPHKEKIQLALKRVIEGTWYWKLLRKQYIYKPIAFGCLFILIFVPDREAL